MQGSRKRLSGENTRTLSETLSVVLLLGIVMVGVIPVVVLGTATIDASMHSAELNNGELAMQQLDTRVQLVASGKSDTQQVTVPLGQGDASLHAEDDTGRISVTVTDLDTGNQTEVVNETFGAVVFEHHDDHGEINVAYQAGGIFKKDHSGVSLVSPPDFEFRDGSLSVPITHVTANGQLNDDVTLTRSGETVQAYSNGLFRNPIDNAKVTIAVESTYGDAWATYLESKFGAENVVTNASTSTTTVEVRLRNAPAWRDDVTIQNAITSTANTEQIDIRGASYIDSYDSRLGAYAEQSPGLNGSVHVATGVELDDGGTIYGNLNSGAGTVSLERDDTRVSGMLRYGGTIDDLDGIVGAGPFANGTSPDLDAYDAEIEGVVGDIETENGKTSISETGTTQLGAGTYYFEELDLDDGGELVLDTADGDVTLGIGTRVRVEDGAKITVIGDGNVTFYHAGNDFEFDGSELTVSGDDATRVVVVGTAGLKSEFDNSSRFVGVIFATGDDKVADDRVRIRRNSNVYRAVVGDVKDIREGSGLHFDEALLGKTLLDLRPKTNTSPGIEYLFVTVRPVAVE